MRLLTIRNYAERYGSEGHMLRVAVGLAKQGWDVHAAFPQAKGTASMAEECGSAGIHYHALKESSTRFDFRGADTLHIHGETLRLIREVKPDVVQVTLGWPNEALRYAVACGIAKAPTLAVFQLAPDVLSIDPLTRKACAWARARNQQWVAVSEQNRQALSKSFDMPAEAIKLIYNGAETETEYSSCTEQKIKEIRRKLRTELGIPEESRLLLTVGRLSVQKGYSDLLGIALPIAQEFPGVHFVWAGTGEEQDKLSAHVRRLGLGERVHFLGYRSDIPQLMTSADLLVFPTRAEGGCSSTIRESMVHGLPIVSTDAGGIPEIVERGVHGVLVPICDSQKLHESVRWALSNPDEMRKMAAAARLRIQQFSTERMVSDYKSAFEELVHTSNNT